MGWGGGGERLLEKISDKRDQEAGGCLGVIYFFSVCVCFFVFFCLFFFLAAALKTL